MPRTGALLSLSREHHTSLVLARAIKKVLEDGDSIAHQAMAERIKTHWFTLLAAHFDEEEHLIQDAAAMLDAGAIERIRAEHAELSSLADTDCPMALTDRLLRFAELIAAHVRYEERVLFPQLQAHLSMTSDTSFHSIDSVKKDFS